MNNDELFMDAHNLPSALSKKELYELLEKAKNGDEDARKNVIEHNIRLVLYEVMGRFKIVQYDKKDLVSIGIVGLINAIKNYDVSKKIEFSTYAIRCIDNEILSFLKKLKNDKNMCSLNSIIIFNKEGSEIKFEDNITDDMDIVDEYNNNELFQIIRLIIKDLPERDRKIIMLYFGFYHDKTYSQQEIANIFLISRSRIAQIISRTVKKIGKQLEENDLIELRAKQKIRVKKN